MNGYQPIHRPHNKWLRRDQSVVLSAAAERAAVARIVHLEIARELLAAMLPIPGEKRDAIHRIAAKRGAANVRVFGSLACDKPA